MIARRSSTTAELFNLRKRCFASDAEANEPSTSLREATVRTQSSRDEHETDDGSGCAPAHHARVPVPFPTRTAVSLRSEAANRHRRLFIGSQSSHDGASNDEKALEWWSESQLRPTFPNLC
jgi:hypothetical protein